MKTQQELQKCSDWLHSHAARQTAYVDIDYYEEQIVAVKEANEPDCKERVAALMFMKDQ